MLFYSYSNVFINNLTPRGRQVVLYSRYLLKLLQLGQSDGHHISGHMAILELQKIKKKVCFYLSISSIEHSAESNISEL